MTVIEAPRLTLAEWADILRDPTKNDGYLLTGLGPSVREYLAWKKMGAAPATLAAYEYELARLCVQCPTATIETLAYEEIVLALATIPVGSHRKVRAVWNDFVRWAIRFDKRSAKNPLELLPPSRPAHPPTIKTFTAHERAALLAASSLGLDPARDRVRVHLLIDAGLRRGEALGLRNGDVDQMRREIVVVGKGSKQRSVPLPGDEFWLAWLDHLATEYPRGGEPTAEHYLWFPMRVAGAYGDRVKQVTRAYPDKQMVHSGWHRWWTDLVERARVPYRKPHTTRHTFATETLDATDGDLYAVKELLGHSSTRVTEAYLHHSEKRKRAAAAKLAAARASTVPDHAPESL